MSIFAPHINFRSCPNIFLIYSRSLSLSLFKPQAFEILMSKSSIFFKKNLAPKGLSAAETFFVTLARSVPCHNSVSELFRQFLWPHDSHLLWHALWAVRSYIDRCVAFLIKSNQYNQTQLDSNEGVEPSQGWSEEMDSTWVKYMSVTAKGLNT